MRFLTPHKRIGADLWVNIRLRTVERLARPVQCRVLDLGCGPGYLGQSLTRTGNDVYYLDASARELDAVNAPTARKFIGDAAGALPFKDNFFDWVYCGDLLEHLEDDQAALNNIFKALKPGGKAVLFVPAHSRLFGHHDRLLGHLRRYDATTFRRQLQKTGFSVSECRYVCSLLLLPFLVNQWWVKQDAAYRGTSRIEPAILPVLNLMAEIDSRIRLPFGISLLIIVEKRMEKIPGTHDD